MVWRGDTQLLTTASNQRELEPARGPASGLTDLSARLVSPNLLFGRDRELAALISAHHRIVSHAGFECVVVSGAAGIGKSALVDTFRRAIIRSPCTFAAGKFGPHQSNEPYETISQALRTLVELALAGPPEVRDRLAQALQDAVGVHGALVSALIPELDVLIGVQASPADLSQADMTTRFQQVFGRFVQAFATAERPLVLFLDDLHWADSGTIALLEYWLSSAALEHVLLVCALRHDVVPAEPSLGPMLARVRASQSKAVDIRLGPLTAEDVRRLVVQVLQCTPETAAPVADILFAEAEGNPFFTGQLLTRLAEEGSVEFDPALSSWTWGATHVKEQSAGGGLDSLVSSKLAELPAGTLLLVQLLACIRSAASTTRLARLADVPEVRVAADLNAAVTQGLVTSTQESWSCVHDRVREAVMAMLTDDERADRHWRIGHSMAALEDQAEPGYASFETVDHLNRGSRLITDRRKRGWLAGLNLVVGDRARLATAYSSAAAYYLAATELLDRGDETSDPGLTFELHLATAECDLLRGEFESAMRRLDLLRLRARSRKETSRVYRLRVTLHVLRASYSTAVDEAIHVMKLHGVEMSAHPSAEELEAAVAGVWNELGARPISSLIDLPLNEDEDFQLAAGVLAELLAPACFTDERLAVVHLCHLVRLTLVHGVVPASVQALAWFGIMIGHHHGRYQEGIALAQVAHDLVRRHRFEAFEPKALFALEIAAGWVRPPGETIELSRAAFQAGSERGDVAVACFACHHTVHDLLLRGDPLPLVGREIAIGLSYVRRNGFRDVRDELVTQERFVDALCGNTSSVADWDNASFDRGEFEAELTAGRMPDMTFTYWVTRGQALFLANRMAEAVAALDDAAKWAWSSPVHARTLNQPYFHALALASLRRPGPSDTRAVVDKIRVHRRRLALWSENNPSLFGAKVALVDAEVARLEQRPMDAARLYMEAIAKSTVVTDTALANEFAANFFSDERLETLATSHRRAAVAAYRQWGAVGKVSALLSQHSLGDELADPTAQQSDAHPDPVGFDFDVLLRAIQSFSGEILLDRLIHRLMRTVLAHSGADRGLLITEGESDWVVSAEALVLESGVSMRLGTFPATSVDIPNGVLSAVAKSASAAREDDVSQRAELYARPGSKGPGSYLCVPLLRESRIEGMLYLESSAAAFFTADRESKVQQVASQAAVALRNSRLYETALRDSEELRSLGLQLQSTRVALQESEARFGRMAASTADVIWITQVDPEQVIYVSPSFERIWGRSCEDLYRDPHVWIQGIHPDDQANVGSAFIDWLKHSSDRPWQVEFRVLRPDGTVRWIQERGAALMESGSQRVSGISTDITERRIAEKAQFDSEQRFALAVAASNDGLWHWDLASELLFVSERAQHLCGIHAGDTVRTRAAWQALIDVHPEDRTSANSVLAAYVAGVLATYDQKLRVRHPDGRYRWVRVRGLCTRDAEGHPQRMAGSVSDIDAQKQAESALKQSEQRHALAMEATRDGHWDWIIDSDEYHASPRMLEIYGFPADTRFSSRDEFLRRLRLHPEDRERWKAAAAAHFAGESSRFEIELRVYRNDRDEIRWVRTSGLVTRDGSGKPIRYTGSVSDITDRKSGEQALRKSEERFALAVSASSDGIWDLDVAAAEIFISEHAQRVYGLDDGPTLRPLAEYRSLIRVHPDHLDHPFDRLDAYLSGQLSTYEGEWQVAHPDGRYRWVRVRGLCVRDDDGKPTRVAGSVSDIDDRRRAEQALHQAQRLDALGTLAGGIAHDFNNILGAILGFGEMAVRHTRPGSRARRDLDLIVKAGERGRSLVEGILGFSRSGVSERVPVDVRDIAQEALQLIAATAPSNVHVAADLPDGSAAVLGDPTQIHQVLMNLMTNALQAMPHGGNVALRIELVHLTARLACTTGSIDQGEYLKVTVQDEGIGIAPDLITRVFDPFFTTKEVGAGTGLGLSLVHGIVAELNGAIEVISALGRGSAFIVYLPRSVPVQGPRMASDLATTPRGRHQQILVVDDEDALRELTTEILKELDYVPVAFGSGSAALAAFTAHPDRFDAIVTDERMPGLGGIALIKSVKAIRPAVPVLLVSGYLGTSIVDRAKGAGAGAVLRKPVAGAELGTSLARLLAQEG